MANIFTQDTVNDWGRTIKSGDMIRAIDQVHTETNEGTEN